MSLGRPGQILRGKSNSAKVAAPLPVNLPSRRLEKGHDVSLVSSGSSWGSPSMQSSAVLGSSSSTASSPAADGSSPLSTGGASAGQGGDSPQPEAHSSPSTFPKAPRAWGVVAQTHEQHLEEYPTAAEAAKKSQELHGMDAFHWRWFQHLRFLYLVTTLSVVVQLFRPITGHSCFV